VIRARPFCPISLSLFPSRILRVREPFHPKYATYLGFFLGHFADNFSLQTAASIMNRRSRLYAPFTTPDIRLEAILGATLILRSWVGIKVRGDSSLGSHLCFSRVLPALSHCCVSLLVSRTWGSSAFTMRYPVLVHLSVHLSSTATPGVFDEPFP